MANMESLVGGVEEAMDLPPGFRFHPTDEELISHYLCRKVVDNGFSARAIGEVDMNKCEPWDLPRRAKIGEKEWYFFCVRDRKYPTGLRTNRATEAGYWKATGKDKEIFKGKTLVGMKKTLVFYTGRAPKGENSNWVMHEYRLEGRISLQNIPFNAKNEWVICRVFQKNAAGEKIPLHALINPKQCKNEYTHSGNLPPLMESLPYNTTTTAKNGASHVSCFSNPMNTDSSTTYNGFTSNPFPSIPSHFGVNGGNSYLQPQTGHFPGNYIMSDQHVLRAIFDNHGIIEMEQSIKTEAINYDISRRPFDDPIGPSTSGGLVGLESLWNY